MPDRNLRERDRAWQQRQASVEAKVRSLGLRAWPGAVRTAPPLDTFTPSTPAEYSQILSVTVPSGRWIIMATASAGPVSTFAADEVIVFSVFAYDQATSEPVAEEA